MSRSDHLLEVDVADVLRVVIPGHGHDATFDLLEVRRGRLVFPAEAFVRHVPCAHDDVGLQLVQLDDDPVQQVGDEVNRADMQIADVRDGYHGLLLHDDPDRALFRQHRESGHLTFAAEDEGYR